MPRTRPPSASSADNPQPSPSSGRAGSVPPSVPPAGLAQAYQGIITAAMDAIVAVDEGQLVILFNAAAERMFGCPAAQALGQPLDQFLPSRYREAHRQHIPRFGRSGQTHREMCRLGEVMGRRANGEEFPIEASISQTEVDGKKIYTAILRDISARKRDEEIRARLAAIIESSDDAIIGKNLDGIITNWNHAAEQMFGYTAAEVLGQPITLLLPPNRLAEEARIIEKIRAGERVPHFETVRRRKNGTHVEVWLTVSPIRDASGRVVGASKIVRDITRRKNTEQALNLFRALIDESDDAFEIVDPATARFLDVNEKGCADLGYTREEMLQFRVFDIDPTVKEQDWPPLMERLRQQGAMIIERAHQRRDGTTFPIEINMKLVTLDRAYVVVVVRDITKRKQAEQLLFERQEQLSLFIEHSPAALAMFDQQMRYLAVSRRWLTDYQLTDVEVLGRSHYDIFPDMPDRWRAIHRRCLAGATEQSEEDSFLGPDGVTHWLRWEVRPWRTLDQTVGGIVIFTEDITRRRSIEQSLRETTERFREIAENIHEVFWVTNPSMSAIYYVSPAYEKIWGRTCASLYADPYNWIAAIHPEDRERVGRAAITKGLSGNYDEIYRIIQPEGSQRWIHDRAFPVRDATGAICRLVGVAEDITNQRKLEEQFRQAQKMEAIGTLAGGIAHDFNNILAAVNGYAELAKMKAGENSPLFGYLDAIGQAGARAAALVRQILTFSRQQEQQRRPIQLAEIVDEAHKLLRATIPATIE
ncbi:MAG TPA: PAS domain S-box protein, partial [Opitutales bacterium]|nr:PAS domain S-box protein [Opitutales bacterium]